MIKANFLKLLVCFLTSCCFPAYAMDKITVDINKHPFYLEVPQTPSEYSQGLMYRKNLDESQGMIFLFNPKDTPSPAMWMKDTYISLDMLFVGSDYRIKCILAHTEPLSLSHLTCNEATLAVIELKAGDADKYQLKTGMKIKGAS